MIHAFPKIFAIGTVYIKDIFKEEVEITEKIDGSQFNFGKIDGELFMRSKGKQIFPDAPEKMFTLAVNYVLSIQDKIPNNTTYYCEYLNKPKHNVLTYERVPINNLILFGVSDTSSAFISNYENLVESAVNLSIEFVPRIFSGKIDDPQTLLKFLETDSILGNTKVEGIIIKNYKRPFLLGGMPIPLMMGKYVSEKFKEKHDKNWGKENTSKGKWQLFVESYRTEARWLKTVQHLRDNGELKNSPRDIGKLIIGVKEDIKDEETEIIKNFLWKEFSGELLRKSTAGLPEWYKKYLLKNSFEQKDKIK